MIPNTEVHLLKGVPLFLNEPHQLTFTSVSAQSSYFEGKRSSGYSFQNLTTVKENWVHVAVNYEEAKTFNYLQFKNASFKNKWFYAFITDVEYVNTVSCRIHFQIDHFQTWYFDLNYKASYIERAHVRRFNSDGTPIVYTAPENLDYGTEYEIASVSQYKAFDDFLFMVVVCKEQMHGSNSGKVKGSRVGIPQPLSYYVLPFNLSLTNVAYSVGSTNVSVSNPNDFLTSMFTQEGAVDNVVSIYITESFSNQVEKVSSGSLRFNSSNFEVAQIADNNNLNATCIYVKDIPEFGVMSYFSTGNKYSGFKSVSESKLLMYPYAFTELIDNKGNKVEIKNEYVNANVLQLRIYSGLGPSPKVIYEPDKYKHNLSTMRIGFEDSLISDNPNDLPVLADTLSAYFQGQRNQIENTKSQMIFNTVTSVGGGFIGGAMMGGAPGATVGAVGGAISGLGNAYYNIEGLNAKQKDIQNTPPSLAKLGGNTAFDFGNRLYGVYVVKKQITSEYRTRLEQFFKMYGYRLNELRDIILKSRENYNFIKTADLMVSGNVPQESILAVKQLFNNGVTLWHNPSNVGNYSVTNGEV